ncbi:MAG: hypothetical protein HY738_01820 [Bacteroidia bacterium]|nr:hypothetical protein [Bacteroidia bacterium]
MKFYKILAVQFITLISVTTIAQPKEEGDTLSNINIKIVDLFKPSLSDAFKQNDLPQIIDTVKIAPAFDYSISSKQINTEFTLDKIRSAKISDDLLTRFYMGYIKLGFGNYITPLAWISLSNLRSKDFSWSIDANHLSSNGKVKNERNQRVFAGYADDLVRLSANKFYKFKTLYGDVRFDRNAMHYYGYNTSLFDTTLEKKDISQNYTGIGATAGLKTNFLDSSHLNYDIRLKYNFFQDKKDFLENHGALNSTFNYLYNKELFGADMKIELCNENLLDTSNNILIKLEPWTDFEIENLKITGGLNIETDIENQNAFYHLYPVAELQYDIIDRIIIPYIVVNGEMETNHYRKIVMENPYIVPGLCVANTNRKLNINIGVRGNINSSNYYDIGGKYSQIDSMYFFVNDTNNILQNQFSVVYDYVDLYHFYSTITLKRTEKLDIRFNGNYHAYTMQNEEKPWHKPDYEVSLTAKYNLQDKINIGAELFVLGKRYAKSFEPDKNYDILKEVVDFNIEIEYRYTKILSGFINFNNIIAMKYYKWNHYPMQRFNIMAGITYSLFGEKATLSN